MRSMRILSVVLVCVAAACSKSDKDVTDSATAANAAAANASANAGGTAGGTAGAANAGANAGATNAGPFAAEACVVGTWKKKDGTFTQTMDFRADKTGEEVQSRDDKRTFEWKVKNDSIVEIHYTTNAAAKSDWDVSVDCKNNKLSNGVNTGFSK